MVKINMEGRQLLGVYESEKAIVRIYTGPMSDTPEKRRALIEPAAISYAKSIRKNNPEIWEKIVRRNAE